MTKINNHLPPRSQLYPFQNGLLPVTQPRPKNSGFQVINFRYVPESLADAAAMPSPSYCKNRPIRSAKQAQPAPGYVDSSALLFDSEDEGIQSEGEYCEDDVKNDHHDDGQDRPVTKKPRLKGKFKARPKDVSQLLPDSSCLAYYPETYEAVRLWNQHLNLPPPHPRSDASTNKAPELILHMPVLPALVPEGFRTVQPRGFIKKNEFYDETKAGFEKLPGEIRNKIYALVFKKQLPIDFINRSGFARSAAFLRVNKLVHHEARRFVYSENCFYFGYNFDKSGEYFVPDWKELGWTHIRRFLAGIGPENTSLIQKLGIKFYDARESGNQYSSVESRRFTNNQDVLWILNHLSRHGRLLHLKLGFSGRRTVRMSPRDGDFLQALKGVKTDKLTIGDPKFEPSSPYSTTYWSKVDRLVQTLLPGVMVRPLPLKDLDPRLKF